ncbi:MAG: hypothetical protein CVV07_04440 [Gammaproteobacteria bacterium HGW-Gammaproteobacteria-11]|nr:MAG: hypothetical protein CVV07_04440 [Gammaproteobacteria bacterium HGW-Gammaproteobacteria-11]
MKASFHRPLLALSLALLLSACVSQPPTPEPTPEPASTSPPTTDLPVVYAPFPKETLYDLLTAEIAGQRNRYDIALGNYLLQAHQTRDAGIIERALRVAEFLGAQAPALEMALLWTEVAPDNPDAFRSVALHQARAGQHELAMQAMEKVLSMQGETHFDFLALTAAQTDSPTRQAMLTSLTNLRQRYPDNPQLLFSSALLLQQEEREDEALTLLENNPLAAAEPQSRMLHARLLADRGDNPAAIQLLQQGLLDKPDDNRMRLLLARVLVSNGELDAASAQFALLSEQNPADTELLLSLALISLETGQFENAVGHFEQLLSLEPENDTARYHLGVAFLELKQQDKAIAAWREVRTGRDFLTARLRISQLLSEQGETDQLAALLSDDRSLNPDLALQLYLIEIESLFNRHPDIAMQRVNQALNQFEQDSNLLYTRALLAEQLGQPEQLEADLRQVLLLEPDNASALNALGYTLADRNERLDEALAMIERAAQLSPDDPAITDSLGWVHFRLGNLDLAEQYLRQAYAALPDQEVAAHLGEVLWHQGKRQEARRIWNEALEKDSDSPLVRSTRQRLEAAE